MQLSIIFFLITFFMTAPAMDETPNSDDDLSEDIFDVMAKDPHKVKTLIKKHPEYLMQVKKGYYPIHEAAERGLSLLIETFIDAGMDIDQRSYWGERALTIAAKKGDLELVADLVSRGSDPYNKDLFGRAPIAYAVIKGHETIVDQFLLQALNSKKFFEDQYLWINGREVRTNNLLTLACCNGHFKIAQSLLKAGAPVTIDDPYDIRPLYIAAKKGYKDIAALLLRHGADVNDYGKAEGLCYDNSDIDEPTPLIAAIWSGNVAMVQLFLKYGANKDHVYAGKNAKGHAKTRLYSESVMHKAYEQILKLLKMHKFCLATLEDDVSDLFESESAVSALH